MEPFRALIVDLPAGAVALVALAIAVFFMAAARRAALLAARARALPVTRLDRLVAGALVRVEGRVVRGEDALTAPVSQKAVVWFALELFARRRRSQSVHDVTVFEERCDARCVLSDQHGLIEIPLAKARVISDDKEATSGAVDGAPAHIREAIRARHADAEGLSYRERTLACGDVVSAVGTVVRRGQTLSLQSGSVPLVVARGRADALVGRLRVRAVATGLAGLAFLALAGALFVFSRGIEGA
jgi:hypothetical protein